MRKQYIEPELLVEDFTVSEMIAANCELLVNELTVVQQMSHTGCEGYYDDWQVTDAYAKLSDSENIARLQIVSSQPADFCKYLSFSKYF